MLAVTLSLLALTAAAPPSRAAVAARAAPPIASATLIASATPAPAAGWRWPLEGAPRVLATFAPGEHRWSPGRRGVDLAAGAGQAVVAPVGGTVTFAGRVVDRSVVAIEAPSGLRATLEPVAPGVAVGDVVAAGEVVGTLEDPAVGRSRCAPATCLHWGVRRGSGHGVLYLDPLLVLLAQGAPGTSVLLPWRSA